MPISVAVPPISSTANGRATYVNMTPTTDVACPRNSLRYSASRSAARLSVSLPMRESYSARPAGQRRPAS